MTLKSSEVQDCSWWVSTILKSILVSSSSCDPIPSPEERLICSQSYFVFSFVLGPGTDSTNCAGIRSYIIRCSLCARNSRTLGSQLHSDFSFRDCQEKDNRIILPWCSSTFLQTNVDNTQNGSEDCLFFSKIQSLHHFLEVDYHDEEDSSVSSTLLNRRANIFLVQYRSNFSHP